MVLKEQFLFNMKKMLETDEKIDMDTDLLDIDAWNSLSMMAFIAMVEENYSVRVENFSVAEAVLVEDLFDIVAQNVNTESERE